MKTNNQRTFAFTLFFAFALAGCGGGGGGSSGGGGGSGNPAPLSDLQFELNQEGIGTTGPGRATPPNTAEMRMANNDSIPEP